ncbi:MAG: protease pro-enzyme activation domain-containing protein [Terracidiphilus sp.]
MHKSFFPRFANLATVLTSLLAVTPFLAGSWQAGAESPTAGQSSQAFGPAGSVTTLANHTPSEVLDGTAVRASHYDPEKKLRLTLAIQPPHMAEEEEFIKELTTKGSPNFHEFLTPEEWNARFAPSAEDEQAVVDWAVSQGLTVTHRFNHRLLVDLEGTSGLIEKAFNVTINQYQNGDEVDFSNDRDPQIPTHLAGILYNVEGLNSIQHEHNSRPGPQGKAPDYAEGPAYAEGAHNQADAKAARPNLAETSNDSSNSTLFTNGYANPTEIYSSQVYNYDGLQNLHHCCNPHNDSGGTPNVSNIAIAAFGNFNDSDVVGFQAAYPYLAYNYTTHFIDGSIDCTTDPGDCPSGETTQDVEWTIATANSFGSSNDTAKIYPYIGANYNLGTFTDMYGFMLSDNLARVFTTSWSCTEVYGCDDSTMDARHKIFNSMIGQGWTLIAASGDRGSSDDCYLNKSTNTYNTAHESVAYPGSDYDVLAAGGTYLLVYNDGSWDYEHAWAGGTSFGSCGHNNGGSGGGVSSYYGKPGFQDYSTWSAASKRQTPDISLNAVGIGQNLYINGTLQCCANGTSIVAPELAGFFAQENAYLNYIGNVCGSGGASACTPVGPPMQFFYPAAYYNDASHFPFYDMTGPYCNSNDVTMDQGLGYYCTGSGWDNVTGWGSANMLQLAWAIHWHLIPASGSPSITWSGPTTGKWYNSDQQISWTINDYGGGTYPGTGIAGFTQGWDSIPPDSSSKPHGGTGDTFWSGPEYPNYTDGCMTLVGNPTCPGGVSQGCHTAHVRGWNNQGWTTGEQTYGSICYDTVAPTIGISNNPVLPASGWWNGSVAVTLTATDPGGSNASGIYKTYYAINRFCNSASLGSCSVYSGPVTISAQGYNYIWYFTEDNAGNFSTETYEYVDIDTTPPVTTGTLSGTLSSGIYDTAVGVTLSATDNLSGVAHTYYSLDGGATTTYSGSAFTVSALGSHTVKYWSVDVAGNTETPTTVSFSIHSPTTAALTATPNPSVIGQSVKMTATITATLSGTPTGTVQFWNGATSLGTATLSSGVATLSTTTLPVGALTLQASYLGAGNFIATNSVPFDQSVNPVTAVLTSPTPSSALTSNSVMFTWAAGTAGSEYDLHLSAVAPGGSDLYASGHRTVTSLTVNGLPTNGEKIYARLYTILNGITVYNDYTYTALKLAKLTSSAPSSTLTSNSVTFAWSAGTAGSQYDLHLSAVAPGGYDLLASGHLTSLSITAKGLPTNGEKIYARLYTILDGVTYYNDYTYTAMTISQAKLTSPTPTSTLTSTSVTFTWSAGTAGSEYDLHLSAVAPGGYDLLASGHLTGLSVTAHGLPTNGETIYARLYTILDGVTVYNDYTYKAQ